MFQFYQSHRLIPILLSLLLATVAIVFPASAQQSDPKAVRPRQVFPRNDQAPDEILKIDTDLVSVDVRANDAEVGRCEICGRKISRSTSMDMSSHSLFSRLNDAAASRGRWRWYLRSTFPAA